MIGKLDFLVGEWNLEYNIPQSAFSAQDTGTGKGEFRKILNNKYLEFNYSAELTSSRHSARAICAWDEKTKTYQYWWFEDSGTFMSASCRLLNGNTLHMNWHNTLLIQTFQKISSKELVLHMKYPSEEGKFDLILEVIFTK